jgi:hypothetical protein
VDQPPTGEHIFPAVAGTITHLDGDVGRGASDGSRNRSATIEVVDEREQVLAQGRYGTDTEGYRRMLDAGRRFPDRVWAVEGCAGIGRHVAQRLVADGQTVLDVPAKLSARVRVFDTGHGRKTDPDECTL